MHDTDTEHCDCPTGTHAACPSPRAPARACPLPGRGRSIVRGQPAAAGSQPAHYRDRAWRTPGQRRPAASSGLRRHRLLREKAPARRHRLPRTPAGTDRHPRPRSPNAWSSSCAIVAGGLLGTVLLGRLLRVPSGLSLLIACGFSICGAAAVAGAAGVTDPDDEAEEDTITAVALVVIFGTLMIALVPLLANLLGLGSETAGMWAGGSIHEIAQVVAVGGIIGGGALTVAVIVKLARVLLLAPVVAILSHSGSAVSAVRQANPVNRGRVRSCRPSSRCSSSGSSPWCSCVPLSLCRTSC